MSAIEAVVLLASAFVAGAINAVAGGGSLISFPALLAVGFDSKVANVTNTVSIWPGMLGGSWAYRVELSRQRDHVVALFLPALLGSLTGVAILLSTPESTFDAIVPFLILAGCWLLAYQDRIARFFFGEAHAEREEPVRKAVLLPIMFVIAIYGAYFGAGMGIIILAVLGLLLPDDIQRSNALKGLIAFFVNLVAAAAFAVFGEVAWEAAAVMAVGALAGGYAGVSLARRLPRAQLRLLVIGFGLMAAGVMFVT